MRQCKNSEKTQFSAAEKNYIWQNVSVWKWDECGEGELEEPD